MADYEICVFCDDCGQVHTLGSVVSLDDGPADPATIGDYYKGKPVPPALAAVLTHKVHCNGQQKNVVLNDVQQQCMLVAIDRPQTKVSDVTFTGSRVILDGHDWEKCHFNNCELVILSLRQFNCSFCTFSGCTWTFSGPAALTIQLLEGLRKGLPQLFNEIISMVQSGSTSRQIAPTHSK